MSRVLRFWWGGKISEMSKNRHACYRSILKNSKVKQIEILTPDNYRSYEVVEHPIHRAFPYLSAVHQGDYLRAYITYFYGGGWTDIKYCDYNWNPYFDLLDKHLDKIGIGTRIMVIKNGVYVYHEPDDVIFGKHANCISMAHFIFRKRTDLFEEYLTIVDSYLDKKLEQLKKYPGSVHPLICKDNHQHETLPDHLREYPYPLKWLELSEVFHHVQLPYLDKIMQGMPIFHTHITGYSHR